MIWKVFEMILKIKWCDFEMRTRDYWNEPPTSPFHSFHIGSHHTRNRARLCLFSLWNFSRAYISEFTLFYNYFKSIPRLLLFHPPLPLFHLISRLSVPFSTHTSAHLTLKMLTSDFRNAIHFCFGRVLYIGKTTPLKKWIRLLKYL